MKTRLFRLPTSFLILILTLGLLIPSNYAAQAEPRTDLGEVVLSDIESGTAAFEAMLKQGGPRLFSVDWKNDSLSSTLLSVSEDRASENLKSGKAFFRLHFYQDKTSGHYLHYVDQADMVISSMTEFSRFLANNKGKTYDHLTLKLNDYESQRHYPYPKEMGLKGSYDIDDEAIAGGAVLRTLTRYTHRDVPPEKKYKVQNPKEFKQAMGDALKHFYYTFSIETPTMSEALYPVGHFYQDLQDELPECEFSDSVLWSYVDETYRVKQNGKTLTQHKVLYTISFNYPDPRPLNQARIKDSLTKVNAIIANTVTPAMSDLEKIQVLHDYLVTHTTYDDLSLNFDLPSKDHHLISAPLLDGKSVCSGYAWAMQAFLNKLGIPNLVISGEVVPSSGGDPESHAWNMVKLNGQYYHLDSTWDDRDDGNPTFHYGYFLVDDTTLSKDHFWNRKDYPACTDGSLDYYLRNGLLVETYDDFQALMEKMLSTGGTDITFRSNNYSKAWLDDAFKDKVFKYQPTWHRYHYESVYSGSIRTLHLKGE